jgi:quinol monooxygenase YgiN
MPAPDAVSRPTVIAEYRARPGRGDDVADILPRHVAATRAEPGCITFVAYRDADDPDHFVLYEQYVDEDALEAHRQSPHFTANVLGRIVPLLEIRRAYRLEEIPPQKG